MKPLDKTVDAKPRQPADVFRDCDMYEGEPNFNIYSWCPTPAPTVPPTQVHLHASVLDGKIKFVFRFKGPGTLDRLIDALIEHREDVWGKRPAGDPSGKSK